MEKHHRTLIQCLLVMFLGALTVWPMSVVMVSAGIRWTAFAMLCAVAWGMVMGAMLATEIKR